MGFAVRGESDEIRNADMGDRIPRAACYPRRIETRQTSGERQNGAECTKVVVDAGFEAYLDNGVRIDAIEYELGDFREGNAA